jgi:hypothetical protein
LLNLQYENKKVTVAVILVDYGHPFSCIHLHWHLYNQGVAIARPIPVGTVGNLIRPVAFTLIFTASS